MKTSVSEKRTQVYFPEGLYRRVQRKAREKSTSSSAVIREAVEEFLAKEEEEKKIDWENDPFLKAAGFIKNNVTDMSVNLDHYLYGARKKVVARK